jgi:DNA-binding transcriptional regulator YdaS (Cro superfamily)
MESTRPILAAIKDLGSEAKLAHAAGVSQPAIHKAKNAERVSAELAVKIEVATGGRVPRWELRPDLWQAPSQEDAA